MKRTKKRFAWLRNAIRSCLRFVYIFNLLTVLLVCLLLASFFWCEYVSVSEKMVWTWYWMLVTVAGAREAIRLSGDHHPGEYVFRMLVQGEVYVFLFALAVDVMFVYEAFSTPQDLLPMQEDVLNLTVKISLAVIGLYAATLVSKKSNKQIAFLFSRLLALIGVVVPSTGLQDDVASDPPDKEDRSEDNDGGVT